MNTATLSDLTFDHAGKTLLALIPALANLGIFLYILLRFPARKLAGSFAIFALSLALWQLSDAFLSMSRTAATADLWLRLFSPGILLIAPAGLHFALRFTGSSRIADSLWTHLLLYLPAVAFEALLCAVPGNVPLDYSSRWGWVAPPDSSTAMLLCSVWVAALCMTTLTLLFAHALQGQNGKRKRRQALLIAAGFALPTIAGTFTQVLGPAVWDIEPLPLSSTFMTSFSIAAIIALARYKMLQPRIEEASGLVFDTIHDYMFIVSGDGRLRFVNPAAAGAVGIDRSKTEEYLLGDLFPNDREAYNKFKTEVLDRLRPGKPLEGCSAFLRNVNGEKIPVLVSAAVLNTGQGSKDILLLARDLTERRLAEERFKEIEERFSLLVGSLEDYAIFMVDTAGKVASWNLGAQRIYGYTAQEIIGRHISVFYTRDESEHDEPSYNLRLARENGHYKNEGWRRHKNGGRYWADVVYTALFDEAGHLRGYAKITRDITARREAEEALQQSRSQLAMAQQLAQIGSWEWDLVHDRIRWSDKLYGIFGLEAGAALTEELILERVHPGDRDAVAQAFRDAIETRRPHNFYYRIVRPDKTLRYIHARGEAVADEKGKVLKVIGTGQDITDRLQEEEMDKLAVAATQSSNSVLITDRAGRIEWVNEGFTRLTGYSLQDVRYTHIGILRKGRSSELSQQADIYGSLIREKKPLAYESKSYTKQGKLYWVITTLTPVLGNDGEVERVIAIDSDITERKQMEDELITANRLAEHSLKKGNKALDELMRAKKQLEESMRVKEQFLAKMSHEIRTPMNAIIGMSDILQEMQMPPEQEECVDAIKISAENLLSIINDILDFSKIESGKISFEAAPFVLKDVLSGVAQTMHFSAERKGIAFSCSVSGDLPAVVIGDAVRLRQILLNLAGNAIKFTEKGRVTVEAKPVLRNGEMHTIRFSVSDTGIGIPSDKLDTIFESFNQVSNKTSRKYGGTGLGLTIVKQLVEMQGGIVNVESSMNEGSTFHCTLTFRQADPESLQQAQEEQQALPQLEGLRVLLAEDNEMNRIVALKVLNRWNVQVDSAPDGLTAITMLERADYDLILMDIQMPELDGYEATRHIRRNMPAPKSQVPIIAMTAHAIVGEAQKCIATGMNDYISKPFQQRLLYEKIAALAGRKNKPSEETQPEPPKIPLTASGNASGNENKKAGTHDTSRSSDLSYLQKISEGNGDFVKTMIRTFLEQIPAMLEDMERSLQEKNWPALSGGAHKLRSSVEFMGIHSIEQTVREIEQNARAGVKLNELPEMVAQVQNACGRAMEELRTEIEAYT